MTARGGTPHVVLVGAGLAGPLLAVYLAKKGFAVDVYERRPDMRRGGASAGRSINLALSARGIQPLREVGIFDDIAPLVISMRGRMIHGVDGSTGFQPYGHDDSEVINAVSRADLNMRLMDLAERQHNVRIHFSRRCLGMDFSTGEVLLRDERTGDTGTVRGDTVIATDGSASAIRTDMLREGRFDYTQTYLAHGYKELHIPPAADGGHRMESHALHIWPRTSFMLIALPNLDGSFTCTLFFPFEGSASFATLDTPGTVEAFFAAHFPDALERMPDLAETFFANPTGSLVTVSCAPWHVHGAAALVGDAAHAMVPFFGQGMNCAFEDCAVLSRCIDRYHPDWEATYAAYHAMRKTNADAISALALENFIEMRDLVADPRFQLMKRVGLALEERFPERFVPKYSMVSFHRIPYATALERGRVQDDILRALCAGVDRLEDVDWERAAELVARALTPFRDIPITDEIPSD